MDPEEYVEIFRDDFQKLNRELWKAETGTGKDGWGNWEKQTYTESPKNSFVEDSVLNVKIVKEDKPIDGKSYTSARLHTKGTFSFTFGRVEARVRLKAHPIGPFSAIWLLSDDFDAEKETWPMCGEIDMFEYNSIWVDEHTKEPYTPSTLHFEAHHAGEALSYHNFPILAAGVWHDLVMEWTPDHIHFFQNGKRVGEYLRPANPTQVNWPYHKDNKFHFIINNAMSPSWANVKDEDVADFKDHSMEIDYIVVKQKRKDMK